ncbi:transposase [Novosphingobium sp. G106]|nr:transposase [Novosphingobium sp. G106]
MDEYIGLDVSLKETAISVRRAGKRVWRGKCVSDPQLLAAAICKHAPSAKLVVFETGPLAVWFFHALTAEGLPAICIDARHAKAALDIAANKTDANDADGLAHLAEVGFFREVRVKAFDSMLSRTLVAARIKLVRASLDVANQMRGFEDVRPHHSAQHGR